MTDEERHVIDVARLVALVAALALLLFWVGGSHATWKPEYAQASPEARDWYANAELTDAAKKRFPFSKCCDHSDVVQTQFRVSKTSGDDEWWWVNPATNAWERVPPDIIHWGKSAPGGKPTLFVYGGKPTCFFPGDGGI